MSTRRRFLSAALVGLSAKGERKIAGGFVNEAWPMGHRLRDRVPFPAPRHTVRIPVVIVGGGIAGLSAAWRLAKRGFTDFVLLEMEPQAGGNARSGENEASAYPWAAHYVPVPDKRAALVRELFEEFGILRDGVWDERYLCFSPQERLYLRGRWQEGIEPSYAATREDIRQMKVFESRVQEFRATGQFTIPMERGAKSSPLDQTSIGEWLRDQRLDSPYLNWYVNYACRDDYGALATDTSAWAGIHYFASREPDDKGPITAPEGNGWIVKRLVSMLARYIRTGAMVHHIAPEGRRVRVLAGDTEYIAERVIFAAPTFLAPYVIEGAPHIPWQYSPWLTANLTLEHWPREDGSEPAWDNVIYDSPALGYVVATHQSLRTHIDRTVWTFYWSLAEGTPQANRRLLLDKDWGWWRDAILADLGRAHPDIGQCVSRIDIMRLGHAMIRPTPGFLADPVRARLGGFAGRILYANSDVSGLSLFEEAQYRGVRCAEAVLI